MQRTIAIEPAGGGAHRFATWVAASTRRGDRVLNIGAGSNRSSGFRSVLARRPYVVGVDPDSSIWSNDGVHERHQLTIEDYAATDPETFDVAFCIYVLEHVQEPVIFYEAVARVLKPNGAFFALTLNMHQYFGFITWAVTRAGVQGALLRRLKGEQVIHEHGHHPTAYHTNSIRSATRFLDHAGFTSVDFRCFEATSRYAWYLPAPIKPAAAAYTTAVYRLRRPGLMGHMSFRAVLGGR
jgi:SAM-dependent methyltransferase